MDLGWRKAPLVCLVLLQGLSIVYPTSPGIFEELTCLALPVLAALSTAAYIAFIDCVKDWTGWVYCLLRLPLYLACAFTGAWIGLHPFEFYYHYAWYDIPLMLVRVSLPGIALCLLLRAPNKTATILRMVLVLSSMTTANFLALYLTGQFHDFSHYSLCFALASPYLSYLLLRGSDDGPSPTDGG